MLQVKGLFYACSADLFSFSQIRVCLIPALTWFHPKFPGPSRCLGCRKTDRGGIYSDAKLISVADSRRSVDAFKPVALSPWLVARRSYPSCPCGEAKVANTCQVILSAPTPCLFRFTPHSLDVIHRRHSLAHLLGLLEMHASPLLGCQELLPVNLSCVPHLLCGHYKQLHSYSVCGQPIRWSPKCRWACLCMLCTGWLVGFVGKCFHYRWFRTMRWEGGGRKPEYPDDLPDDRACEQVWQRVT